MSINEFLEFVVDLSLFSDKHVRVSHDTFAEIVAAITSRSGVGTNQLAARTFPTQDTFFAYGPNGLTMSRAVQRLHRERRWLHRFVSQPACGTKARSLHDPQ